MARDIELTSSLSRRCRFLRRVAGAWWLKIYGKRSRLGGHPEDFFRITRQTFLPLQSSRCSVFVLESSFTFEAYKKIDEHSIPSIRLRRVFFVRDLKKTPALKLKPLKLLLNTANFFQDCTTTLHEPSSVFNHIQYSLLTMGLCISTTSRRQSTRRIEQGAISAEFQQQRYASFSCYTWLVTKIAHGQQSTYHVDPHPR